MSLDPLTAVLDLGGKVFDRLFPDPAQAEAAKLELLKLHQSGELALITGQLNINAVEAASTNWFVAGWRPAIGWVCGTGLTYAVLIEPLLRFIATMCGYVGTFPIIDTSITMQILFGMLGLAGLRTIEKHQDVENKR